MKRILITGANSYIGMSFENYLSRFDGQYLVDTLDVKNNSFDDKSYKDYDCILHVAGIVHQKFTSDERAKDLNIKVNTELSVKVAQKAKEDSVKQFIFLSTAAVYGASAKIGKDKMIRKATKPSPCDWYGESKLKAEQGLSELQSDSFNVAIVRTPLVYGFGCKGNYPLLSKIAQKTPVFPKISNSKSMIFIDNLCEFLRLLIENDESGIFWPQNTEYVNTSDMVKRIAKSHNKKLLLIWFPSFLLSFMGLFTNKISKAFGSIAYSKDISEYKNDYNVVEFDKSILKSEGVIK